MLSGEDFEAAARAMLDAERVVVCPHIDPDGDAAGSLLGLTMALRSVGVDAVPTLAEAKSLAPKYRFMAGRDLLQAAETLQAPALFVALDSPSFERLGAAEELARKAGRVIVIDHHPDCKAYGGLNLIDPEASATGEIVWRLLKHLRVEPDAAMATCLYTAVVTDTGRFQYDNTTPETLRFAAEMLEAGADAQSIRLHVFESISAGMIELTGRVLARLQTANGGRVAWSWYSTKDLQETAVSPLDIENLVDSVKVTEGIEVAFLVKCQEKLCKVSLRSKTGADVGRVARSLGGGGHKAAAGFALERDLEETVATLLPLLPGGKDAQG